MTTFDDIKLQVGARLQIMREHIAGPQVHYTTLIGYVSGEYLLVKIPFENGLSVQMQSGETITLRTFSGTNVFTFSCNVESIALSPRFYMHLSFPQQIQVSALRKAIRVKAGLPVEIEGLEEPGIITDISVDGAQILTGSALGELGGKAALSFTFQIKPTNQKVQIQTDATICSMRALPMTKKDQLPRFSHGVLFNDLDPTKQVMLQNLIYELLLGLPAGA